MKVKDKVINTEYMMTGFIGAYPVRTQTHVAVKWHDGTRELINKNQLIDRQDFYELASKPR